MSDIVIFTFDEIFAVDSYKSIVFLLLTTEKNNRKQAKQFDITIILQIKTLFLEQRDKLHDTPDDPLGEMEMANVMARKQQRTGIKTSTTAEVNIHSILYVICCISSSFFLL